MKRKIHLFDNGIRVYDDHLTPDQRERYRLRNVHEADEEKIFFEIIQAIPSNGCFVNVGAAIGYYSILAKKISPELLVFAIEPLDRHRIYFKENWQLNKLNPNEINLYNEGISTSSGDGVLIDKGFGSSLSSAHGSRRQFQQKIFTKLKNLNIQKIKHKIRQRLSRKNIQIKTITLESLFAMVGRSIDLVQMDIQGLEADVLNSSQQLLHHGQVKTFLIGTHGKEIHQRCLDIFKECDYTIEHDQFETKHQPDGIIVASKDCRRLTNLNPS